MPTASGRSRNLPRPWVSRWILQAMPTWPTAKITPAGTVSTLAGLAGNPGSADGYGADARFNFPVGIAVDTDGNVYVADQNNATIRKVSPEGSVTTLAGLAGSVGSLDGIGTAAQFNY